MNSRLKKLNDRIDEIGRNKPSDLKALAEYMKQNLPEIKALNHEIMKLHEEIIRERQKEDV